MSVIRSQCQSDKEYVQALRDEFAATAMQGLVTTVLKPWDNATLVAHYAYVLADSMLKERSKT